MAKGELTGPGDLGPRRSFRLRHRAASHVMSHDTWAISKPLNDWFIANYLDSIELFHARLATPPGEIARKINGVIPEKVISFNSSSEHWGNYWIEFQFSWRVGWINRCCKRWTCYFLFQQCQKPVPKTEKQSNDVVLEFLFHICNLFMSKQRFSPEQRPNPPPSRFLAMATRREPCFEPWDMNHSKSIEGLIHC